MARRLYGAQKMDALCVSNLAIRCSEWCNRLCVDSALLRLILNPIDMDRSMFILIFFMIYGGLYRAIPAPKQVNKVT
jgi:hypothetical protein